MINLIVIVLFLTLTDWIAGYREVVALVRDDSWLRKWFRIKFWYAKWNLDSYHFMGGLRKLLDISAVLLQGFWLIWFGTLLVQIFFFIDLFASNIWIGMAIAVAHIPLYWWFWYYQRNVFMHIIARKKEYRQWKYLNPFQIKKEN